MAIIKRDELMAALESVKGAVAQKGFLPILQHVLIEGKNVIGYDSEIGIRYSMTQDNPLEFNVPYEKFSQLVRNLEAEDITIEVDGKKVSVACGKHRSVFSQILEPFPKPEVMQGDAEWVDIPAGFKEAVERASIACHDSEKMKIINAVCVKGSRVYGTLGNEAVRCTLPDMSIPPVLLGKKAIGEILRLGNPVRALVADPWVLWDYTNLVLITRLREGVKEYPDLDPLFLRFPFAQEAEPIPDGLGACLGRIGIFLDKDGRADLTHNLNGRILLARTEAGELSETVDPNGGPIDRKGFNPSRLAKALPFADALRWGGPREPVYLRGDNSGFEYLLAPMS